MKTNNNNSNQDTKICKYCKEQFTPHAKVGDRQTVCSRSECQQLRQKINHQDWLERNPVDYRKWYQDYGKAWRQCHPDYQREYRKRKKAQAAAKEQQRIVAKADLKPLLWLYQHEKKEELTSVITNSHKGKACEKKEELTHCYYLLKAIELELLPLIVEKKEELSYCIHSP
jgi:hypothetical protein